MKKLFTVFICIFVISSIAYARVDLYADADIFGDSESNMFKIEFVTIPQNTNPASGYGIVDYDYRISVYEISNDLWNKFEAMYGPVEGSPASAYGEPSSWVGLNQPVNKVSWYEAAQFVNWLNTSKGYSPAYKFTGTQGTGGYTFEPWSSGDQGYDPDNPYRNSNAFYFLPTEHEWVKAGYWNGTYLQTYSTRDDTLPYVDVEARYDSAQPGTVSPWDVVGKGCWELNGTFDMTGNVWEWMESPFDYDFLAGSNRCSRGGAFDNTAGITSGFRLSFPADAEYYNLGFRVTSLPLSDNIGDLDGDGDCDLVDFAIFADAWLQ